MDCSPARVVELIPLGFDTGCGVGGSLLACIFPSWSLRGSECSCYQCRMKLALGNREGKNIVILPPEPRICSLLWENLMARFRKHEGGGGH